MQFQNIYEIECEGKPVASLHWDPLEKVWTDGGSVLTRKGKRFSLDSGEGPQPCRMVDDRVICGEIGFDSGAQPPQRVPTKRKRPRPNKHKGVGTCLANRITGFLRVKKPQAKCGCSKLAASMDSWGPEGCEARREEIVDALVGNADMLADAIQSASIPGCKMLAGLVGTPAAKPILRVGANWLLTGAIKDAETHVRELKAMRERPAVRVTVEPPEPFPFTAEPRCTLISHLWPKPGWDWHLERLAAIQYRFARKIVGVAVDGLTETFEEVSEKLGPGWELLKFENVPRLREVVTYPTLLDIVADNIGENEVTFCHHFKGTQEHNQGQDTIEWWSQAMYDTVIGNVDGVIAEMAAGATVVGSFRRFGRMLGTRHRWHFSGTYYAIRNARAFLRGVPKVRRHWWGTESWPGDYFPASHSACIFGDNVGDLYQEREQPRAALERWRADRADDA